jgi:hypothetical protein
LSLALALLVLGFVWKWAIEKDRQWRKGRPQPDPNGPAHFSPRRIDTLDEKDQTNAANPGHSR